MRRQAKIFGFGGKGPKMKVPESFTGKRDDVTRFIQQCQIYLETKKGEFANEKEKIMWITLLCNGRLVEGWVDWITTMVDQESPEAPTTGLETLAYLKIYFGDPNEEITAQHQLDALTQTK